MKKFIRMAATLAVFLSAVFLLPAMPKADGSIDTGKAVLLSAYFLDEGTPVEGARLRLYRIASVDEDGTLIATPVFERYEIVKQSLEKNSWEDVATTLEGLVGRDGIEPNYQGSTSDNGVFEEGTLAQGLYLMLGDIVEQGENRYIPSAAVICLPSKNELVGDWVYDLHVSVKYDVEPTSVRETARKTIKIWNDNDNEAQYRPDHVEVVLIRDDSTVVDSQVLSADNNWTFDWDDLDASHKWTVSELNVARYIGTVVREGQFVSVVNQFGGGNRPVDVDPPYESTVDVESPVETETPRSQDETGASGSVEKPGGDSPGSDLPKTGQLWWPVLVLAVGGMSFILVGISERRRKH